MFVLPGRRSAPDTLHDQLHKVLAHRELIAVLDHLPYMALVLTTAREVVYANRKLLDTLGQNTVETVLARRPGELLECIHSRTHAEGCGGAEGCRHCQAWQVITDCLHSGVQTVRDVRVSARHDGRLSAYDLKVTATPLVLGGEPLVMIFFEDVGAQKRREHLERIFLHDLLNTAAGLQLFGEALLADPAMVNLRDFERQIRLLGDEIRAQQLLVDAERGELARNILCVPARQLLDDTLAAADAWRARNGVAIVLDLPEEPAYLATDPLVARRVLLNAVKNAVEAAAPGETVKIGVSEDPATVSITVWNPQVMAEGTRHQIFQRSFSTKGPGRGLGTYSMRLLMENYLDGSVDFTSEPSAGTTFTLTFPSTRGSLAGMSRSPA